MFIAERKLHILFEASAFLKAVVSAAEIILGILFFSLSSQTVNQVIFFIFGDELTEVPRDPIWVFLLHGFNGLSASAQHFWGFIFIAHGIAILCLVIGLVSRKLWIYPAAAITFGCFVVYQIYHVIYAPSLILLLLTTFDILFMLLIVQEYRYQQGTIISI